MESVLRATSVYVFMLILVRVSGRRTLSEITSFDFVLLMIISEATQNAMLGDDFSITNAILVVTTLIAIDVGLSILKRRSNAVEAWLDGVPTILVADGRPLRDRMVKARVELDDILETARLSQGLERFDQIKYAVLERSGGISIIPKSPPGTMAKGKGKSKS